MPFQKDVRGRAVKTYVKPSSAESENQKNNGVMPKKIYPKIIDMEKIGETFTPNLTDKKILRQGIYEYLEDWVMKSDLRQMYENGICKINVEQVFVGPGEFLRVYGPLMNMTEENIKREARKKNGRVGKLTLPGNAAHVEAHVVWGPVAARGFAYTLRKDENGWILESTDPYWQS
jgi:hypothetical protein